ncbi:MAG TPA: energy transducer TonB [Steroidobacteraceae bacterium]|jgi:TonB family protein
MKHASALVCALLAASVVGAADLPRCEKSLKVAQLPEADYPPLDHMVEGTVLVEFTVDVGGQVSDATIVETSNRRLNDEALRQIGRMRFTPPQQACRHQMPLKFQLK